MAGKQAHKERTRARILEEAASALRTEGAEGIGVAALMKRAGLTHGGFYAHFASRDDLLTHAVDRMFADSGLLLAHHLDGADAAAGLSRLIDYYLSERALGAPGENCPLTSLAGEAARMPIEARERFVAGMTAFRDGIVAAVAALGRDDAEALGASVLAEMVGAMTMARVLTDKAEAAAMLKATRRSVKERLRVA